MKLNYDKVFHKKKSLVYLASPYSHRLRRIRHKRFVDICAVAGILIHQGIDLICPIAHSHPIEEHSEKNVSGHEVWMRVDLNLLSKCTDLYVVTLAGWKESYGVQEEIKFAQRNKMPITYVNDEGEVVNVEGDQR